VYTVKIDKVENGFIVRAGCKNFVFQTYKRLEKELKKYLEDPEGYIKKHRYGECAESPAVIGPTQTDVVVGTQDYVTETTTDGSSVVTVSQR